MRDPTRIPRILDRIANQWKLFPDMRLTQLIVNAVGDDNYAVEDEKLAYEIERFVSACSRRVVSGLTKETDHE